MQSSTLDAPDALSEILGSVRMRSAVFSRAELSAPWSVASGRRDQGTFHAIAAGRVWAWPRGADNFKVELGRGDVVLFPHGDDHVITDAPGRRPVPMGKLTVLDRRGMGHLTIDGGGAYTSLVCGSVEFDTAGPAHPVMSVLPRMLVVRDREGQMISLVESLVELIAMEVDRPRPGSETVVARLADVLIVYMLRDHIQHLPDTAKGWLAGLRDAPVAAALGLIHRRPHHAWTTGLLATEVGLSRSAFSTRFKRVVGETPGDYLLRWRIHVGSRLLRDEQVSVAAAARRVGYRTESAFSNAFLRVMGVRPGAYRRAA